MRNGKSSKGRQKGWLNWIIIREKTFCLSELFQIMVKKNYLYKPGPNLKRVYLETKKMTSPDFLAPFLVSSRHLSIWSMFLLVWHLYSRQNQKVKALLSKEEKSYLQAEISQKNWLFDTPTIEETPSPIKMKQIPKMSSDLKEVEKVFTFAL